MADRLGDGAPSGTPRCGRCVGFPLLFLCLTSAVAAAGWGLPFLVIFGEMAVQSGEASDAAHALGDQGNYLHEVTAPSWLETATPARAEDEKFPSRARLKLMAEGKELILELHKNRQLLAPGYTETHYSRSGIPIVNRANRTEHCYYHGAVQGMKRSHVVLSTCSGFRGLISLSSNLSYMLEPLRGDQELHIIYRTEHLKLPNGTCGHQHSETHPMDLNHTVTFPAVSGLHRVKREDVDNRKYVELYLVADYAEFQKHEYDLLRTKQKMVEVANYIDKFYKSLNVRVALVGLEVWTDGNKCNVTENPYSTLWSFLAWRRKLLLIKKHDNAQLITGRSFLGTTIGLAPLLAMCSVYQSGGVNMDHSENSIGIASTMAHEMGHNFGMSHDSSGCCAASPAEGGCIMAAATGHPFPKVFNKCNRKQLERFLQSGGGMCLSNRPDSSTMYGGSRCGNEYLEDGEECDCGEAEECTNPCCNASNCTLKLGAECAHGICCQQCQLRAPGTLCRKEARPCDLPEYCTGKSPYCPSDSYQLDGTECQESRAYCYSGMCLTHQQQCAQLWGPGAKSAPDICFQKVNAAGDTYGNCGKDIDGKYKMCATSDARCGKIQCQSSVSKPLDPNAVPIDTTVSLEGKRIRCRGTHVYRAAEEDGDILDPGLVMTGTKCGENQICFEGKCRSVTFFQTEECTAKCHRQGVCNNNRNCHCFQGWDPPFCNRTGNGGSVDSGPPPPDGSGAVVFGALTLALLLILLPGAAFFFYIYKRKDKTKPCSNESAPEQEAEPQRDCSNSGIKKGPGHANPTYRLTAPTKESEDSEWPSRHIAPSTQPPPTTAINPQPSAIIASNLHTASAQPSRHHVKHRSVNIADQPKTDTEALLQTGTARLQTLQIAITSPADTVNTPIPDRSEAGKPTASYSRDMEKADTVRGSRSRRQTDSVRHPLLKSEAELKPQVMMLPTLTPAALQKERPAKHPEHLRDVYQKDSMTPPSLNPGTRHQTVTGKPLPLNLLTSERDTARQTSWNPGTFQQTDLVRYPLNSGDLHQTLGPPSENTGTKHKTKSLTQLPQNGQELQSETLRLAAPKPGIQHLPDSVKRPPKKPSPPAPTLAAPKKFNRADPPQKPLPTVPVRGRHVKRPGTECLPPITVQNEDMPQRSTKT